MAVVMKKKTRVVKGWSKRNLPEELWPEILSRLPARSLVRFRSVSKSWRSFIDDPDFQRLHLSRFSNNRLETRLFVVQKYSHHAECVVRSTQPPLRITNRLCVLQTDKESVDTVSLRTTPSSLSSNVWGHCWDWGVVCSIDGLILLYELYYTTQKLMLWNPSIKKTRLLPLPPSPPFSIETTYLNFGLGFDPLIRDYKVVRFAESSDFRVRLVAIYTLGTNSWKSVDFRACKAAGCSSWGDAILFPRKKHNPVCLKGVLYSLAKDHSLSPLQLVSFDLSCEVFASTSLPLVDNAALTTIDGGCSLALVGLSNSEESSIWVLESLGTADIIKSSSWTQRYTFTMSIPKTHLCFWRIVSLRKNCEILLHSSDHTTSYNLETHAEKIILPKEKLYWVSQYMESLILL